MSSIINPGTIKAATYAAKQWYDSQEETHRLIIRHSCIGGGLALIPYPIVGEAACFVNQIAMYRRITKAAGMRFSEKVLLNVGKFLASQAAGLVGGIAATFGISAAVKFVPGLNFLAGFAEAPAVAIANYVCGVVYYKMIGDYISNGGRMDDSDEEIVQRMCSYPIAKEDVVEMKRQAQIALKDVNYLEFKADAQTCIDEVKERKGEAAIVLAVPEVHREESTGKKILEGEDVKVDITKPKSLDEVKARLRGIIGSMAQLPGKYGTVAPSPSLIGARELLGLSDYEVVVCGEARQGKSSFINALLGDASLLPVDTVVTTSQVFRIGYAEHESFYLVFEDGTRIKIDRAELSRYGRQSDGDIKDEPLFMGRNLKWIEVNVPSPNLPKGLHILDTPGLGSLYAEHAKIAMRYLTNPDAVIFVTNTNAPITETELKMIEAIFAATDNVLFVLSMSDSLPPDQLASRLSNNEEVLNNHKYDGVHTLSEKIGRRIRIWPVSSKRYFSSNPKLVATSGFTEMLTGLQNLFERTRGLTCSQMAYTEALTYYNRVSQFRKERLSNIDSPQTVGSKINEKEKTLTSVREKWGSRGTGRIEYEQNVRECINNSRIAFTGVFPKVRLVYERKVDAINQLHDVKSFEETLAKNISEDIQREIDAIAEVTRNHLAGLTSELQKDIVVPDVTVEGLRPIGRCNWTVGLGAAAGSVLSTAFNTSIVLTALTGVNLVGGNVLAAAFAVTNPVGWVIGGILLFSAGCKFIAAQKERLEEAKMILKENIETIVGDLRSSLMANVFIPPSLPIDKWLHETKDTAISGAETFADREIKRLEEDISQLKKDAEASDNQREAAKSQMTDMGQSLEQLQICMNNVHEFLEGYANDTSKSF